MGFSTAGRNIPEYSQPGTRCKFRAKADVHLQLEPSVDEVLSPSADVGDQGQKNLLVLDTI